MNTPEKKDPAQVEVDSGIGAIRDRTRIPVPFQSLALIEDRAAGQHELRQDKFTAFTSPDETTSGTPARPASRQIGLSAVHRLIDPNHRLIGSGSSREYCVALSRAPAGIAFRIGMEESA